MSNAVLNLFCRLLDFYMSIGVEPFRADVVQEIAHEFSNLYSALVRSKENNGVWFFKPKMHLILELCFFQIHNLGGPALYWACRDEDFVGFISTMANSQGGARKPATIPSTVFARYGFL